MHRFALTIRESNSRIAGTYLGADNISSVIVGSEYFTLKIITRLRNLGTTANENTCYDYQAQ